jgi:hypothetical protein
VQASKDRVYKRGRYIEYLATGCADCGERDPVVLDADHLRDKRYEISKLLHGNFTWRFLEKELEKCVVRCANCHRKRTGRTYGNYRMRKAGGQRRFPSAATLTASD